MESKKRFSQVYVEISNQCNWDCSFCPGTTRPAGRMTPAFFLEVARQVAPWTNQIYLHVLGEPLAHPELDQILMICQDLTLPVALTTNGTLIAGGWRKLLLQPPVRQINFSLQALDSGIKQHQDIFFQILDFVKQAVADRPELYINLRLWNFKTAREGLVTQKNSWFHAELEKVFQVALPDQNDIVWRKSRQLLGRVYLHADTEFQWPGSADPQTTGTCRGLVTHCGILTDGTVIPCCLDQDGRIALGKMPDQSFSEIIQGSRALSMLQGFRQGILKEELCQNCSFCRRFPVP